MGKLLRRARRSASSLVSLLIFALVGSALLAAVSMAQETAPAADPAPAAETAAAPEEPAPPPVPAETPPAPAEPAPAPPAPETETAPTGIGVEVVVPSDPAPAAPQGQQAPADQSAAPAPADSGAGQAPEEVVKEPAPSESSSGEQADGPAASGGEAQGGTSSRRLAKPEDHQFFLDNCRGQSPSELSQECKNFLYPYQCDPRSPFRNTQFCNDSIRQDPCVREPDSESCRQFTVNTCFTISEVGSAICYFIRDAFFSGFYADDEPDNPLHNPCRVNPQSAECERYASQEECDRRGLTGDDCELFRDLRRMSRAEAELCRRQNNGTTGDGEARDPDPGSTCAALIALVRRACAAYPPAFGCYPMEFSTSEDELTEDIETIDDGNGGGTVSTNRPGGSRFRSAISDPGGRGEEGETQTVSDEGEDAADGGGGGGDDDEPLPRSGFDLALIVLLGLGMAGSGMLLQQRMRRIERGISR